MKNQYTKIALLSCFILVVIGFFAYKNYIVPSYSFSTQSSSFDTSKGGITTLYKKEDQGNVYGLEIEFSGSVNDNFEVTFIDTDGPKHNASIKGDNVDYIYKADWYSDSVQVVVTAKEKSNITGTLNLEYRFLSLD